MWPEHQDVLEVFGRVRSQWRVSPGGAYGLDYGVVFQLMDRMALTPSRQVEVLDELRVVEAEALRQMHDK